MAIVWRPIQLVNLSKLPVRLRTCLQERGSLSHRLQKYCQGQFHLEISGQSWKRPLADEARELRMKSNTYALVRETYLKCQTTPWVYARSIIPPGTLRGQRQRFASLGKQPLGSLLFSSHNTFRDYIEIAIVQPGELLHHLALKNIDHGTQDIAVWGRRSIFWMDWKPLLVVEIFLPGIVQ